MRGAYLLKRSLRFFDRDSSGGLSFSEFQNGLDLLGLQYSEQEALALMARHDPDCSNDIEYDTLVDMISSRAMPNELPMTRAPEASHATQNDPSPPPPTQQLLTLSSPKAISARSRVRHPFGARDEANS